MIDPTSSTAERLARMYEAVLGLGIKGHKTTPATPRVALNELWTSLDYLVRI